MQLTTPPRQKPKRTRLESLNSIPRPTLPSFSSDNRVKELKNVYWKHKNNTNTNTTEYETMITDLNTQLDKFQAIELSERETFEEKCVSIVLCIRMVLFYVEMFTQEAASVDMLKSLRSRELSSKYKQKNQSNLQNSVARKQLISNLDELNNLLEWLSALEKDNFVLYEKQPNIIKQCLRNKLDGDIEVESWSDMKTHIETTKRSLTLMIAYGENLEYYKNAEEEKENHERRRAVPRRRTLFSR